MKICQFCNLHLDESEFPLRKDRSNRIRPYCKKCANEIQKARYAFYRKSNPFVHRCTRTKTRAKSLGVPFNLTPEYLESIWTGECPVLKLPISITDTEKSNELAAELDRFIPSKGYVKGNVTFLSRKMNRLKNSSSVEELEPLLEWMKNYEN